MAKDKSFGGFGGLHLMGGALALNTCSSTDFNWYCQLSRFFSSLIMIITIISIIVVLYQLAKIYLFNRKK